VKNKNVSEHPLILTVLNANDVFSVKDGHNTLMCDYSPSCRFIHTVDSTPCSINSVELDSLQCDDIEL
jgi:hypothetical protein